MNRLYNILFLALLSVVLISCSNDEQDYSELVSVQFNTVIEQTNETLRSYGDGLTANSLIVGIYDSQMQELARKGFAISGLNSNISIDLIANQTYNLVFWAQNSECPIYDLTDMTAIKMTAFTSQLTFADAERSDAFVAVVENLVATRGASSTPVTLERPLAQVNVGTAGTALKSKVVINGAPDIYYPLTKMVGGQANFTWDFSETTSEKFTVESTAYTYMALGYLFAPKGTTATVSGSVTTSDMGGSQTIDMPQLEIEANCKTNALIR